jgi:cytochrome c-type biogenesis protein
MDWIMQHLEVAGGISPLVYLLVLLSGAASALTPCFMPVLAMFGGYISGYARDSSVQAPRMALAFTLGQALTLAMIGIIAALVGRSVLAVFTGYELDRYVPATLGILMGLQLLGIFKVNFPVIGPVIGSLRRRRPDHPFGAFSLGIPFGFVVTPCSIPIFLVIMAYLATQASLIHGALLMMAYAFGRGIILIVVAYSAGLIKTVRERQVNHMIERASGVVILAISLYVLFYAPFSGLLLAGL